MPAKPIDWQPAHPGHAFVLQQFVCTNPPKRAYDKYRGLHHPKPWELEVQSHLRERRPPLPTGEALLLGFQDGHLIGASHYGFDTSGEHFIIFALARAEGLQGSGIGDELLGQTLTYLRQTRDSEGLTCDVFTRIHDQNTASQGLFARAGFEFIRRLPGDLELWGLAL